MSVNQFRSYSDLEVSNYNTAVTRLWLAGDESFRVSVMESGAEMTARNLW